METASPRHGPVRKLCAVCDAEIEASAESCPLCGRDQPHLPTVIAAWVAVGLFVLGALKACLLG